MYTLNTVTSISKIPMNGINENKIINIFAVTNQILVKVTYFALKKIDKYVNLNIFTNKKH